MGAITGLLAFMGVLYSIHNANRNAMEAKKAAEKVRKEAADEDKKIRNEAKIESEKLRKETLAKDERDLFFRLVDSHQTMMNSLTGKDLKTGEKTIGTHAIDVYKKELDADYQLLVTLWGTSLFMDYESWSRNLGRFAGEKFELTLFAALFCYNSDQINKKDESLLNNQQVVNNVNLIKSNCFHELRNDLRNAIKYRRLKPIYVNFSTEEMDDLSIYFDNVWQ